MTVQPIARITNYHAHIYFDGPEQRARAEALREEIAQRFSVTLGRWHDRLVGPHTRPMYQVAFAIGHFATFVPWLMLNRRGLAVLVHPDTGQPKRDHLVHAIWLGEMLPINDATLRETDEPEPPLAPNTTPSLTP
ncbi:MAG TPA: DOPA 4,5-dioxygenase family protein [Stellaceae bacterium]|jgi:DOPA 4,5-dioxygenase|nr:DOPA 4,5-dioxygenase family protein [Stellaceae bacterium]